MDTPAAYVFVHPLWELGAERGTDVWAENVGSLTNPADPHGRMRG